MITEQTGPLNFRVQKLPRGRTFVVHADKLSKYLTNEVMDSASEPTSPLDSVIAEPTVPDRPLDVPEVACDVEHESAEQPLRLRPRTGSCESPFGIATGCKLLVISFDKT